MTKPDETTLIKEDVMADENARKQDRDNEQDKGKAMGAGASGSYQGQQEQQDPNVERKPNETAGQGGGIQGTGQLNYSCTV